jgi:hypothetical protein
MLNDPSKAAREMRFMCVIAALSWLGLAYQSDPYMAPVSVATGIYCLWRWNLKAIANFETNPSKMVTEQPTIKAKSLKSNSYCYYMGFFGCALGDFGLKAARQ